MSKLDFSYSCVGGPSAIAELLVSHQIPLVASKNSIRAQKEVDYKHIFI